MKKVVTSSIAALGLTTLLALNAEAATLYTVQPGDSYWKIGQEHNLSYQEIMQLNGRTSTLIFPGEQLQLPDGSTVTQINAPAVPVYSTIGGNVTAADKDLLARLVRAEAQSEPYAGKVAVAVVVLNRVQSPDFPNSIHDVIYEPGQFSPVSSGVINQPADTDSIRAVDEALASTSIGAGSLFFYNPATAANHWLDSRPTTAVIGHHVFKR